MMREPMDESDMATLREEQERERAIRHALSGAHARHANGPATCPNCSTRNDRMREGYEWCSACAEDPAWHLTVEAS